MEPAEAALRAFLLDSQQCMDAMRQAVATQPRDFNEPTLLVYTVCRLQSDMSNRAIREIWDTLGSQRQHIIEAIAETILHP